MGIAYNPRSRVRVERVCIGQELAFLKSLPQSARRDELIAERDNDYAAAVELWSLAASEKRHRRVATGMGLPGWFVEWALRRMRKREGAA
jgi:hypothetical protein